MRKLLRRVSVPVAGALALLGGGGAAHATCTLIGTSPITWHCLNGKEFNWAACDAGLQASTYTWDWFQASQATCCNDTAAGDDQGFKNCMITQGGWCCCTCS